MPGNYLLNGGTPAESAFVDKLMPTLDDVDAAGANCVQSLGDAGDGTSVPLVTPGLASGALTMLDADSEMLPGGMDI